MAIAVLTPVPATAVEVPPAGNVFAIQTNGPNGAVTLGDWYTSNVVGGGGGYHYVRFTVPCGWPGGLPVYVDLFSPEMNRVSGALAQSEEPNGAYDSTQFELYGPGATVGPGYASPAPGAGIPGTRTTFEPGAVGVPEAWMRFATLAAPVACGSYVVRSEVLTADPLNPAGTGDDQNGWRVRVGTDLDADPTNAPPANYDNPDGLVGTNDEITVGVDQASFQQDSGALACQTFFEYVSPGLPSISFNNFDMDGNTRVRYYAPSDPSYDPNANAGGTLGTLSNNGQWNGGTLATRVGDTILNPESGWWRFVTCISSNNQFIQEGEAGRAAYYTQPPTPKLTIGKSDGLATVAPGQTITYMIDVNNVAAGATAGAADNVVVHDILPAGVTYQSCGSPVPAQGTWTCSESGGNVTFTQNGWINAGDHAQLTVTAHVNQGASGSIVNNVTADYKDEIGNPFLQVAGSDTDAIVPSADLSITKTDSSDPVAAGQAFTYTLTGTNNGPSNATGVTVSDTVPAQFTVTGVSSGAGTCGNVGNVVTCTRPTFNSGANWPITVNVTAGAAAGTFTDTATISGAEADPVPANDSASQSTTVTASADLSITKTDSADPVAPGTSFSYTLTVTNNGPSDASGLTVNDTVPAQFTVTGATSGAGTCGNVGNVVTCTRPSLVNAATWTITVNVDVDPATPGGTYTDTATVSATTADPVPANDSASQSTTVTASADLSITKSDSADPVAPGTSFSYTLTVTNNGPSDASGLTVNDTVPAQFTVTGATSGAGTCGNVGNVVTCTRPSLVNAATWTITVNVDVDPATPGGTYTDTATVSATTADPVPANDSASQSTTVTASADLSITKSDSADPVAPGTSFSYTLTVTNNGPSDASAVVVADIVPAGFTVTSVTSATGSCGNIGNLASCTLASLAFAATWTITVNVDVDPATPGGLYTDTATVSAMTADPVPANDSDSEGTTVTPAADLAITKTDSADPVAPGTSFSYTLTVTNNGPSDASGLTVNDTVPAQFTVTGATSGAGTCGNVGNVVTCTRPSLVNAATWTITVNVDVDPATPGGTYTDTATVSATTADPVPANDSASQSTTVTASADLSITKSDSADPVAPGTSFSYTLTVTNNGPSDASGLTVNDTVPAQFTVTGATSGAGTCGNVGNVVTCTRPSLVNAATWTITVNVDVDPATPGGTYTDTATVSATTADPVPANDSASQSTTVTASADLSITKTDSADPVAPGTSFSYTLTVTNNGPSDASAVVVADTLPGSVTFGSATPSQGSCVQAAGVVTCNLGAIAASAGATISITVTPTAAGLITNTATVAAGTSDPVLANNSASATTTVGTSADLAITKSDGVTSVTLGQSVTYAITITNSGPSAVPAGITVTDAIPAGTTGVEAEADCTIAGSTLTCVISSALAVGASVTYHLAVTVPLTYVPTILSNTATIASSPVTDPNAGNNTATDIDTVTALSADLSITKTDSADPVAPGQAFAYTIVVANGGPDAASTVAVNDTVPAPLVVTGVSTGAGSCSVAASAVSCSLASLAANATWTITIQVQVPDDAAPGTVTNTATVTGVGDTDATNDTASESTTIGSAAAGSADLSVTKSVNDTSPQEGDTIDYAVTVSNAGPGDATGIEVTDVLPDGLTFVSASASQGIYHAGSGVWDVGSLAVGESAELIIEATLGSGTAGSTITNTAAVSGADQSDPSEGNDADTAPVGVAAAGGGNGPGGTAFTGFPVGPGPIVWMLGLIGLGAMALASGRRRARPRRRRPRTASGRYLAEPFFFDQG